MASAALIASLPTAAASSVVSRGAQIAPSPSTSSSSVTSGFPALRFAPVSFSCSRLCSSSLPSLSWASPDQNSSSHVGIECRLGQLRIRRSAARRRTVAFAARRVNLAHRGLCDRLRGQRITLHNRLPSGHRPSAVARASAEDDERFVSLINNPLGGISRLADAAEAHILSLLGQFFLACSFVRACLDSGLRLWQATRETLVENVVQKDEDTIEETSQEPWSDAVVKVKEGAAKAQEYLKEKVEEFKPHYQATAEKTKYAIAESTEEVKRQAEKAREVIVATAKVVSEQSKEGLAQVVESAPQPIKEIAEVAVTAHYVDRAKGGAAIHDFCLGIPYGAILVAGGLLWFIVVGSTNALRFGVGLGGILLASSIFSMRAWKAGRSSTPFIALNQVIALGLAITEWKRFAATKAIFPTFFAALLSLSMAVFYAYIFLAGGNPKKKHTETSASTPTLETPPSATYVSEAPSS